MARDTSLPLTLLYTPKQVTLSSGEGDSPRHSLWHCGASGLPYPTSKPPITFGVSLHIPSRLLHPLMEGLFRLTAHTPPCLQGLGLGSTGLMRDVLPEQKQTLSPAPNPATPSLQGLSLQASLPEVRGIARPTPARDACLRSPLAPRLAAPGVSSQHTRCPQLEAAHPVLRHKEDGAFEAAAWWRLAAGVRTAALLLVCRKFKRRWRRAQASEAGCGPSTCSSQEQLLASSNLKNGAWSRTKNDSNTRPSPTLLALKHIPLIPPLPQSLKKETSGLSDFYKHLNCLYMRKRSQFRVRKPWLPALL